MNSAREVQPGKAHRHVCAALEFPFEATTVPYACRDAAEAAEVAEGDEERFDDGVVDLEKERIEFSRLLEAETEGDT